MNYTICIPSYSRHSIINQMTLKCLEELGIPANMVKIFVVEEEYEIYRTAVDNKYEIVIGKKGLIEQRQFIANYFPEHAHILSLDDDIKIIDFSLNTEVSSLDEFIQQAFQECLELGSYIWSVYPVYNKFFIAKQPRLSTCLNMCVGAFYGFINRPNDPDLTLTILQPNKEDTERSILYFKKDGIVVRYNKVGFKTKYYGNVGGLGTLKERLPYIVENTKMLIEKYSMYGKLKIRNNGIHEFVLNKINSFTPITPEDIEITTLPKCSPELFEPLYQMLKKIKIPYQPSEKGRRGFPKHRSGVFGITKQRFTGKVCNGYLTVKHPEIFKEMERIGNIFCPIKFSSIHLNHNVICPKHKDEKNVGKSVLVSFGEYKGGNIVIENTKYDAYLQPLLFNGALLEHYNTEDLEGDKYSLVYYNSPYQIEQ